MPGREVLELGPILRQARLAKGVSLLEAQQATKIRQSFLAALEEDDYSILPPPVYVRGFIKNYSAYLGLDSQEMGQLFDELLESVAAGYEPYSSGSYGSSDSGGAALPAPSINPQMLAGLSQSEARMVERSAEMINLTPLDPPDEANSLSLTNIPNRGRVGLGSADSSAFRSATNKLSGLRIPEKYVLKPAISPINKPPFYMPSFVPLLLVLIIVGAAVVIAYRGLVVPPVQDPAEQATPIPNVYSKATVTPFSDSAITNAAAPKPTASVASGITPPPFYTPDQALVAPSAPVKGTPVSMPPSLTVDPNVTPTVEPTVAPQTIKVEISASGGNSWLSVLVDGQEKYGKVLPDGQTFSVEGKRIAVRAGAPAYVRVKVNGQDKQYSPPASGIITHTWDVNGEDSIK